MTVTVKLPKELFTSGVAQLMYSIFYPSGEFYCIRRTKMAALLVCKQYGWEKPYRIRPVIVLDVLK